MRHRAESPGFTKAAQWTPKLALHSPEDYGAGCYCPEAKATSAGRRKLAQNMHFEGATSRTS